MPTSFIDGTVNLAGLSVPGIFADIILPTPFLVGVPTNIEGLVGVASWGPTNALIPATQLADAALSLGPPLIRTYDISSHIAAATQVGGAIGFYCVRVSDGTDSAASGVLLDTSAGTGCTLTAKYTGILGNNIQASVQNGSKANTYDIVVNFPGLTPQQFNNVSTGAANASGSISFTQNPAANSTITLGDLVTATASGSWNTSTTSITLAAANASIVPGMQVYDTTNSKVIGVVLTCVGTALTLVADAAFSSTGSSDALTFNSIVTFVSTTPGAYQVKIQSTLGATLQALVAFLNTSTDANIALANYSIPTSTNVLNINSKTSGTANNSFVVLTTVSGATPSGATLSGGLALSNTFWVNVANAINNGNSYSGPSNVVVATAGSSILAPVLSVPITLSGGTDGASGVTDSTLMGQDVLPRKGVYVLRSSGCDSFTPVDMSTVSYWSALTSLALSENMMAIVSTPSGTSYATTISDRISAGVDSPWMWILTGDWPYFYDSTNGVTRLINATAFGIGIVGNLSPQMSPLNKELLGVNGTESSVLGETYGQTDLSTINLGGIDTILPSTQSPGGDYYSFATGRNASSDTAAKGVEYTRLTNFLVRTAQSSAAGSFVGQLQSIQSNDQTRQNVTDLFNSLSSFLASPQVGLGINGQGIIDSPWFVQCNLTNNPASSQARGYLFVYWQVRYLNVIRYFVIKFEGGGNVTVSTQNQPPTNFSQ